MTFSVDNEMKTALDLLCQGQVDEEALANFTSFVRIALGVFASHETQKAIFKTLEDDEKLLALPLFRHLTGEEIFDWLDNIQDDLKLVQALSVARDAVDVSNYLHRLSSETAILVAGETLTLSEKEYRHLLNRLSDGAVAIASRTWGACPSSVIADRIAEMPPETMRNVIATLPAERIKKIERHAADKIPVHWFQQEEPKTYSQQRSV